MSHLLQSQPAVVAEVLGRYALTSPEAVRAAAAELEAALRVSMQNTVCYQKIPLNQGVVPGAINDANGLAAYIHPENIAAAFQSLAYAAQAGAGLPLSPTEGVQVYSGGQWHHLASTTTQPVPVDLRIPPPAPVAPPPAPAPIAPPPAPPAPADSSLASLLDAALGPQAPAAPPIIAPTTVPAATPTTATPQVAAPAAPVPAPVAPLSSKGVHSVDDLNAHYEALRAQQAAQAAQAAQAPQPVTAQGVPGPAVVTHAQAQAEQHLAPAVGLPTADVMADRTGASGRPAKSPFERTVEPRKSVGKPPFWWDHLLVSVPKFFTDNPANALDPASTGSGPVQAYAILTVLVDRLLRNADPALTVAELRQFTMEVDNNMSALPSRDAIYQIANEIFAPAK